MDTNRINIRHEVISNLRQVMNRRVVYRMCSFMKSDMVVMRKID